MRLALFAVLVCAATVAHTQPAADAAEAKRRMQVANKLFDDGEAAAAEREFGGALAFARRARNPRLEAEALTNIGWLQYTRGAMADALTNVQAAYRIHQRAGDEKGQLDALEVIAHVYADTKIAQYDRAIEYYRQLLAGYTKLKKPLAIGDTLYNIGSTLEQKGDYVAAEGHYRRALSAFEKLNEADDVALMKRALGSALMKQGREKESLRYFDEGIAFFVDARDDENIAYLRQFRGIANRRLGRAGPALDDLAAARRYYEKAGNTRFLERNWEEVALVYENLGDWRHAYDARKRHSALQQQLAASRRDELSSRLRVEFDAEKKEQENRTLARENALRATALREAERSQQLQRMVIALTALLAIALAALFWRQVANTRKVRAMAMTDELTRLPNRRHILAVAENAFALAKRNGHAVGVIVFDIDRFKKINDTCGHAAGDEVLKSVAHACRLALRPSDRLGRIGGEEFLIVLERATPADATNIAERLRAAVERLDFSAIEPGLTVTISAGVWVTKHSDAHAAIAAADELLYRAKENGRNRVVTTSSGAAGSQPAEREPAD